MAPKKKGGAKKVQQPPTVTCTSIPIEPEMCATVHLHVRVARQQLSCARQRRIQPHLGYE